nr:hypothetical protein Iba_scaffold14541.2CG0510 [Ipomoea batatas]
MGICSMVTIVPARGNGALIDLRVFFLGTKMNSCTAITGATTTKISSSASLSQNRPFTQLYPNSIHRRLHFPKAPNKVTFLSIAAKPSHSASVIAAISLGFSEISRTSRRSLNRPSRLQHNLRLNLWELVVTIRFKINNQRLNPVIFVIYVAGNRSAVADPDPLFSFY